MRRKCALDALTAGDSLDKAHKRPAMDVIQAGVMCDGDQRTADELAAIAGVPAPVVDTEERFIPPSHCLGCADSQSLARRRFASHMRQYPCAA